MEYAALADVYDRLAATDSSIEKRDVLAATFADADEELGRLVVLVRGHLGPAYDRVELGVSSSLALDAVLTATGASEDAVRERWRETGDLGDAAAWAVDHGGQQTLFSETLTVEDVHERLLEIATFAGEGSQRRRVETLAGLVSAADANEARYVVRTVLGHMRVGVGEGTVRDAVAAAFLDRDGDGPTAAATAAVERAYQVTNDFRVVAATARDGGRDALAELDVELFRPVQVMLAEKAESLERGLADASVDASGDGPAEAVDGDPSEVTAADGRVHCEFKYDGVRVQIHVDGDEVRLFTRRLEEVTEQFPDVVRAVEDGVTADRAVLDGELVGYAPETVTGDDRTPVAFQRLSQRIRRESDVEAVSRDVPVVAHLFDCLYDGRTHIDDSLADRLVALDDAFEPVAPSLGGEGDADERAVVTAGLEAARSARASPDDPDPARALYEEALDRGHEGLMLKNPTAPYEPGRRVGRLLKLKPTMEPLDLVVTRATYSEGRRRELLGRLYLACYDADRDELREVGRLSTGYTDEELRALTDRLESLATDRRGRDVSLDPEVVLEVEYEEIQSSTEYDSGYALRFPRFLGVREDLGPTDADTQDRVASLYESQ